MKPPALVIHVPHASIVVPTAMREQFLLSAEDLDRESLLMTDHYADQLFALPPDEAVTVRHSVSRLVLDPERFWTGDPMERLGMGPVYTRTQSDKPLRRELTQAERDTLREIYREHHSRLSTAVRDAVHAHGRCLIIDAHSFPARPLPYERRSRPAEDARWRHRPAICLGSDAVHTPPWLETLAFDVFAERFDSVAFDRPFEGTIVPLEFLGRDKRVASIMVEVRRDLYMDEQTGEKLPGFDDVAAAIKTAVRELAACESA